MGKITRIGKVLAGIARREGFGCLEVFFWMRIARHEGKNFIKNQLFFHRFSFKTHFSLDNKGVRKICHAKLVSASTQNITRIRKV